MMSGFLAMFWTIALLNSSFSTIVTTRSACESITPSEIAPAPGASEPALFDTGRASVAVRFGDVEVPYRTMAVFALPGEEVAIQVEGAGSAYRIETEGIVLQPVGPGQFLWRAPETVGTSVLSVRAADGSEVVTLNALVMVPYAEMQSGKVRGYPVGAYPAPRSSSTHEERPRGFIQVTRENADLAVSPHFRLGQFVCKAGVQYPKYIVLQRPLLLRLENLLATANQSGIHARTFQVMSAYRTPRYNRAIGNTTGFTRHQYGDAADIFVDDAPKDGRMDDLNHDGRFDKQDAIVLHALAAHTEGAPEVGGLLGGLSAYAPTHEHGAFVHVDTRGYEARW